MESFLELLFDRVICSLNGKFHDTVAKTATSAFILVTLTADFI